MGPYKFLLSPWWNVGDPILHRSCVGTHFSDGFMDETVTPHPEGCFQSVFPLSSFYIPLCPLACPQNPPLLAQALVLCNFPRHTLVIRIQLSFCTEQHVRMQQCGPFASKAVQSHYASPSHRLGSTVMFMPPRARTDKVTCGVHLAKSYGLPLIVITTA